MTLFKKPRVIFDSEPNYDDAKQYLIEKAIEDGENPDDITDDDIYEEANFEVEMNFNDEIDNLNKTLNGRVICIANLGLWHGRVSGYAICDNNLNTVMRQAQGDYYRVMYNGNDIVAEDCHHDGTNYYTFRELREDTNYEVLLNKLYSGEEVSQKLINRYTKSLKPYVKKVYGW